MTGTHAPRAFPGPAITPFGHDAPYSSHQGYGLNVPAMSGLVLATGAAALKVIPFSQGRPS